MSTADPVKDDMPNGSFTAIFDFGDKIYVVSDRHRNIPFFYDTETSTLSSLDHGLPKIAKGDSFVEIDTGSCTIIEKSKENKFLLRPYRSVNDTAEKILEIITQGIDHLKKIAGASPIKIVATGGYDSTMLIGMLRYNQIKFDTVDYEYKKWTYFNKANKSSLELLYPTNYKKMHTWGDKKTIVATGHHADQYFVREYSMLRLLCDANNKDLDKIIEQNKNAYSYEFLIDGKGSVSKHNTDLYRELYDICLGKYHVNHLDNTLYWMPFKNREITNNILSMPIEEIVRNGIECTIQKNIINLIDPELNKLVTGKKNFIDMNGWNKITKIQSK